jgi:Domain of unknown function (DUF1952)
VTRLEVRLLPARQIIGYLEAEYGAADQGNGVVTGDGWNARFIGGEPIVIGKATRVPVLFIEVEGEHEHEVARFLTRMTMRGGG